VSSCKATEYAFATCILFYIGDILQHGKMPCQQGIPVIYAFSWVLIEINFQNCVMKTAVDVFRDFIKLA